MSNQHSDLTDVIKILLLEDNSSDAELCIRRLKKSDLTIDVDLATAAEQFKEFSRSNVYDLVITDYRLPGWNGLDALHWLRTEGKDMPVILVTGTLGDELAIQCMKSGVSDYVLKDNLERLPVAIQRALEERKLRSARDWAERELKQSEEQYRLLFNANPHPMWVFDRETLRFLMVNDAAVRHYGYSLKEFLSMTARDIRPPEEVERFEALSRTWDRPRATSELWKHKRKDGTVIDVEISAQAIMFRAVEAELVLAHDVTAQRRAEAQVRKSKEQLQLLLDSTAEAIYAIDTNGVCTLLNAACMRLLRYTDESQLLGYKMHEIMHHSYADGTPYPIESCRIYSGLSLGVKTHVTDEVFWRADGTSFPAEYWSFPIRDEGRIVGSVITFFDISDRIDAEDRLRRSESRYRSIIERAPYGIFRVNAQGRIVMGNQALARMLGCKPEDDLSDLNMKTHIYADPTEWERVISGFTLEGSSVQETEWVRGDNQRITVRIAGRQLPPDDDLPNGYEVFVEDITQTNSLQKQFEHAQRMEAVGRLAGGVAHDFNNLLMVISGYAQLLQECSDQATSSQYALQIREASVKAAGITRQLLAFSRKQVVDPTLLDLNYVVSDLNKMLPRLLGEDVKLEIALESQLGTIRADRTQIEQVIMNLAVNARDAMPKGGLLKIATANFEVEADRKTLSIGAPPGRYVELQVSDNGMGMTSDVLSRMFEPFFTTKEAAKGTGLGLSTVYGIVKQSHGFISVESTPGVGTTFKVYLPRLDGPVPLERQSTPRPAPFGTETILLVEDDPRLRNVSRVYLESKGYSVLQAQNADEALLIAQSPERIHLLITDLVMPGLGGVDLAEKLVAMRPDLSVILVSGYTDRVLDLESIGIKVQFLQKPFNLDTLAHLARSLLDRPQT